MITNCASRIAAVLVGCALGGTAIAGEPFGPGNILLVVQGSTYTATPHLLEYSPTGHLLRDVEIPRQSPGYAAYDVVVDAAGRARIYNSIALTTYDPVSGEMIHEPFADYGFTGTLMDGEMDMFGDYLFASSSSGCARIDLVNKTTETIPTWRPTAVSVGWDSKLYLVGPTGSPMGYRFRIYDPITLEFEREIDVGYSSGYYNSLDVSADGDMYAAKSLYVYQLDSEATVQRQSSITDLAVGFWDVELMGDGRIAACSQYSVTLFDADLHEIRTWPIPSNISGYGTFMAIVRDPIPEPATITLLTPGLFLLIRGRRKRAV